MVREIIYYASALALYRFHLLTSNNTIPQNMRRFKWHILPVVATIVSGKEVPQFGSKKMDIYAQNIINKFNHHSAEGTSVFTKAVGIIESLGEITNDRLKRQTILDEMLAKVG